MASSQHSNRVLQAVALCCLSALLVSFAVVWQEHGQPHVQSPVLSGDQMGQTRLLATGGELLQLQVVARQLGVDLESAPAGLLGYGRAGTKVDGPLPSTTIVKDRRKALAGIAAVSIVMDPRDWRGDNGIYDNPHGRGKDSHRGACVSFFVDGNLVGETTVGVCIHGGTSRFMRQKSLRLLFRRRYGPTMRPSDILPGALGNNLVLHNDHRTRPFCNPMAYELMDRLGCDVPLTRPVRVFVNGEPMRNIYFATEHLDESYFAEKLGHENFLMHNERGGRTRKYWSVVDEVEHTDDLRAEPLERRFDLDSVIDWLAGVLICASSDNRQGLAYLDAKDGRWQWVVWDLDWAFQPWPELMGGNPSRGDSITHNLYSGLGDVRSTLFMRHMSIDGEIRRRILARISLALNHEVPAEWFTDLVDRYREVASAFGKPSKLHRHLDSMLQFMHERPERLRAELVEEFGIGPIFTAVVSVAAGVGVTVDGHDYRRDVVCRYFAGQKMSVIAPEGCRIKLDGKIVDAAVTDFRVDRNLSFEVVPH